MSKIRQVYQSIIQDTVSGPCNEWKLGMLLDSFPHLEISLLQPLQVIFFSDKVITFEDSFQIPITFFRSKCVSI